VRKSGNTLRDMFCLFVFPPLLYFNRLEVNLVTKTILIYIFCKFHTPTIESESEYGCDSCDSMQELQ
jgi:hypothetical protein